MGEVFLVRNRLVDEMQKALKLIIPERDHEMYRQRFEKEAKVAARVKGKYVAKLLDYELCEDGTPFATWEFIDGQTLTEIVAGKPLNVRRALRLMEQIAAGLSEIHRVAIHRDIKPANLMVRAEALGTDDEELVILDFGLAKPRGEKNSRYLGQPVIPGTPRYMAPELLRGGDVDPSPEQDIYAAGIVLFEILVGVPPYLPSSDNELRAMIEKGPDWRGVLHPEGPHPQLHAFVKRAIEKDPAQRFADDQEFGAAIRDVLKSLDANGGNDPLAPKADIPVDRRPPPPPRQNEPIKPALDEFLAAMKEIEATVEELPDDATVDPARVRIPKFMLYNRAGQVVLAVVGETEVNPAALQKTNEPQTHATLLKRPELRALGFVEGHVHPIFRDPLGRVARIIVDAMILAQAELFPESLIMLPIPSSEKGGKMLVPCGAAMTVMRALHGARLIYANIARKYDVNADGSLPKRRSRQRWTKDPLLAYLLSQQPVKTRFAPTPSGPLHIGNARTALASYLLYRRGRKDNRDAQFHIRIDDTDSDKSRNEFVDRIRADLRILGIHTDQYPYFRQDNTERDNTFYTPLSKILLMAGFASHFDGNLMLHPRWNDNYYNFWLDWRDGPTVEHSPPMSDPHTEWEDAGTGPTEATRPVERVEKYIALIRPSGRLPFYRFAGLGDDLLPFATRSTRLSEDVRPITYVVRDNKQRADLTKVQSHIRAALEEARTRLANDPRAQTIFRDIGLDHRRPIPVPIYLHVPFVVSANGAKLSKSTPDDQYLVARVMERGILPETLVAYLIWTLVPVPHTGRVSLDEIARFTGRHGVECAIACFAEKLDRSFLTDTCEQPISCDLHLLRKANVVALRAMLPWGFRLLLEETAPGNEVSDNDRAVWKLYEHRRFFADWNQVVAVARGPIGDHTINPVTKHVCRRVMQEAEPVAAIYAEVAAARLEIKNGRSAGAPAPPATALLRDLRLLLTGASHSPGIHQILSMLDPAVIMRRLRKADQWPTRS